ncbi:MAG: UDP-3-O-(3-hydroxymyristoyl)glucosamine N-acyltransferase [Gammaproteobacteria bacterium]|nr:UDP-3-O-(3-hydroxymyristoyl)glucosamine N-acyltransferase [Gammaproteobacteria bacterium]
MPLTLQQLTEQLGLKYVGDPDTIIRDVASLGRAKTGELSFLTNSRNIRAIEQSNCSVLIVPMEFEAALHEKDFIFSPNPQLSFINVIELVRPDYKSESKPGIDASAQVSNSARIGDSVSIGPLVVVGDNVEIGSGSQIAAGSIIEDHVKLGTQCYLHSRVTLACGVRIGNRCTFHSGVVIGSDGFGLVEDKGQWIKVPQIGTVIIGNDVEIGANTTVDRGALDDTIIAEGCKLDNLIQVAHNVRIGEHTAIAACVGIAGSAVIGRHCKIGGAAVVLGHLRITDNVMVTAMSLVTKDIKQSGVYSSGTPLMENSEWHKANVRYKSLDSIARKVKKLDRQIG